ncbi:MAG: hypothetical protein LRY73_09120 [Bacillus sp. (in: Bacteria)]|nr:hypothetical protein [Bacillus sp. (in: firmicutes)]
MNFGIIGAMKEEVLFFKESVNELTEIKKGKLTFLQVNGTDLKSLSAKVV